MCEREKKIHVSMIYVRFMNKQNRCENCAPVLGSQFIFLYEKTRFFLKDFVYMLMCQYEVQNTQYVNYTV